MRVISFVPSWSETLIEAGVGLCGRTRFCIHPKEQVNKIPIVGGTKNVDWAKVESLKPDLLIFDKEENPKEFTEKTQIPWLATHVVDLESCYKELHQLGQTFKNSQLSEWSSEMKGLLSKPKRKWDFSKIPGEIEKINSGKKFESLLYLIWKNPWMTVTHETYIGSVLNYLGAPMEVIIGENRYPEVSEEQLKENYLLFSSEPFPFAKRKAELVDSGLTGSLIDGEKYSWYGIRSLSFLKLHP